MDNLEAKDRWMQTFTGRCLDPINMESDDVCIEDIAHALSMQCRFAGHCTDFYSVAEHSVRVSVLLQQERHDAMGCMLALLHDAAETYLPDIVRPIKPWVAMNGVPIAEIEQMVLDTIFDAFNVGAGTSEYLQGTDLMRYVKNADLVVLATEARDLMSKPDRQWGALPEPVSEKIVPWPWEEARSAFLTRFNELQAWLDEKIKAPEWHEQAARHSHTSSSRDWGNEWR
jgi:hypothetical protein